MNNPANPANSLNPERMLVDSIRSGSTDAWQQLIDRFEGRLLAFVSARLVDRSHAEDIVQDTFVGFLNSLPNYDCERPLEGYLFSIAAYKLTDHLRRQGRRHTTSFASPDGSSDGAQQAPAPYRAVSSIARSVERRDSEELALVEALKEHIELLFVAGVGNKEIAEKLGMTEQQVANYKSDFVLRTKTLLSRLANRESFPELG
jgi:RNA polymerase sigma-70 factor, ECF subfamily